MKLIANDQTVISTDARDAVEIHTVDVAGAGVNLREEHPSVSGLVLDEARVRRQRLDTG